MLIKINDKIEIRPVGGGILRDGIITSISIFVFFYKSSFYLFSSFHSISIPE